MIADSRTCLARIPWGDRSEKIDFTSTFGVFCTRFRAIRRISPATSPLDTLGRSGFGEIT